MERNGLTKTTDRQARFGGLFLLLYVLLDSPYKVSWLSTRKEVKVNKIKSRIVECLKHVSEFKECKPGITEEDYYREIIPEGGYGYDPTDKQLLELEELLDEHVSIQRQIAFRLLNKISVLDFMRAMNMAYRGELTFKRNGNIVTLDNPRLSRVAAIMGSEFIFYVDAMVVDPTKTEQTWYQTFENYCAGGNARIECRRIIRMCCKAFLATKRGLASFETFKFACQYPQAFWRSELPTITSITLLTNMITAWS